MLSLLHPIQVRFFFMSSIDPFLSFCSYPHWNWSQFLTPSKPAFFSLLFASKNKIPIVLPRKHIKSEFLCIMSDPKLLVFGSFTEDETKSWMESKTSKNAVKPLEKKEFQFGSLNLGTGITFGNFGSEPGKQLGSNNGKISAQSVNFLKKETDVNIVSKASVAASPTENGNIENSKCKFPHSNGVKDLNAGSIDFTPLSVKQKDDSPISQSQGSIFSVLENEMMKDGDADGPTNGSLVYVKNEDIRKASAWPVATAINLLPRGLINSGNLCFLSATLQALLSCSPFVHLLHNLRDRDIPKVGFPTLNAFAEFISEFDMPSSSSLKKGTSCIETGPPLSLAMFEGVLKKITPDVPNSISGRPRQEDAQEFLSFVMDQMHDELLRLEPQSSGTNGAKYGLVSADDDDWETVGPKNKSAVTRTQSFIPSELSDIFGGQLKSVVTAKGNKASATVQPFLLLHLDIHPEAVRTIEDALHLFSAPENLEGYRASATGKAAVVSARKFVKLQTLSKIMILHLMRFSYGSQGSTKLHKPVRFPLEFMVGRDFLVSSTNVSRRYELVATITHHGREPSNGHYTADARYSNDQWLRYDDAFVTAIGTNKVLHEQAYVLFYKQV